MLPTTALRKTTLTAAILATAGFISIPAAFAQAPAPATPPATSAGPAPAATNIPDTKLDATAAAVKGISAVKTDYQQKVAQAPETDKERLASEANNAMTKAVTDQGLSVAEYTNIITVAQNDPSVHEKLVQRLKK
ncbi:MAG: hypothetical protein JWN71_2797 [Xanthobacteraceae bacterium]|jgi:hypothetical protein|nr:hypothetical protein [Xanthobacteraceae bacterium]